MVVISSVVNSVGSLPVLLLWVPWYEDLGLGSSRQVCAVCEVEPAGGLLFSLGGKSVVRIAGNSWDTLAHRFQAQVAGLSGY